MAGVSLLASRQSSPSVSQPKVRYIPWPPLIIIYVTLMSPTIGAQAQAWHPEWRGLLASPGFEGQSLKGLYFFPGDARDTLMYTTHPLYQHDLQWDSNPSIRNGVLDGMVQAHVNTIVMSYWSDLTQWSPMKLDPSNPARVPSTVLDAIQGRRLRVMPAIEGGIGWEFKNEFPPDANGPIAPGLMKRIEELIRMFRNRMHLWTQMFDRQGRPRYALHILHVSSNKMDQTTNTTGDDEAFARAFDLVANEVEAKYQIRIGFTLDVIGGQRYSPYPRQAGSALERTLSVLAIQGFASEIWSGKIIPGEECAKDVPWTKCKPHDNNPDNLENLANWKRAAVRDWVATGVPVVLDVSNGYDARIVFKDKAFFWGDNLEYTDDRWRNWMSQLKGPGVKGITFNTWNGYTEGYAAVPSQEHGWTVYNWLKDLFEPPPWDCSHMHYINGQRTYRVYGAICEKWMQLGADRGFGIPVSNEQASARGRVSFFADGKAIYWGSATGAHEVHGLILTTYLEAGADSSCLGLPVSDEESIGNGRVSRFEGGKIEWRPGDTRGRIQCR